MASVRASALTFLVALRTLQSHLTLGFSAATKPWALPAIPSVLDILPPASLPPSAALDLEIRGIAVLPNYACQDTINLLRFDALRIQHGGYSQAAGTRGSRDKANGSSLRSCQNYWLVDKEGVEKEKEDDREARELGRAPNRCIRRERPRFQGPPYVGELCSTLEEALGGTSPFSDDADYLIQHPLNEEDEHPVHIHETEASYLFYEKGGFYRWHVDTPSHEGTVRPVRTTTNGEYPKTQAHRRAFSFLLYLGGDDLREKWAEKDGGTLRVYHRLSSADQRMRSNGIVDDSVEPPSSPSGATGLLAEPSEDADFTDILPHEGTMVIFKSEAMCHEVLTTNRKRLALVGWIHGDLE